MLGMGVIIPFEFEIRGVIGVCSGILFLDFSLVYIGILEIAFSVEFKPELVETACQYSVSLELIR